MTVSLIKATPADAAFDAALNKLDVAIATGARLGATKTIITALPAWMLHVGDVILFPPTVAGVPVEDANPLAVVIAVGESADPYLDDAEPVTLITEDQSGAHLIDHVEPQRRFCVARQVEYVVAHTCGEAPCADCVD